MSKDTMHANESIDTPHRMFLADYTYLGQDSEGYYHHADKSNRRVIVCDDRGTRTGRHDSWLEIDPDDVDHVEPGLKFAAELERWADYVESTRGWENRALNTFPALREAFMDGGRQ